MISNIDSNYSAICKLFKFNKESTADIKKKLLLQMAKNNEDKPKNGTKLASALSYYTLKCSKCYDDNFTKTIKKLRLDWFTSLTCKNKEELIKIAKNKKLKKPRTTSRLGLALRNYLYKGSKTYDYSFYKKIKSTRPDWVINETVRNKQILLRMAKKNKNKPNWKTKLGRVLRNYTRPNNRCFDEDFFNKIKKIAPNWFVASVDDNKKELLKLAKIKKSKKPDASTKLGRALRRYQYCPYYKLHKPTINFVKQIKKLKPNWFK